MLEEDYERLQECYKRQGGKLILHFLTFIFGIIRYFYLLLFFLSNYSYFTAWFWRFCGSCTSFCTCSPNHTRLIYFWTRWWSNWMMRLDFWGQLGILYSSFFPSFTFLFDLISYGLFSFYLLLCCIKGNFKFGMRIFIFPIHPMRVGNTLMHAFLFNVALILICSFAVTQFCTTAFSAYTSNSDINNILSFLLRSPTFFFFFWRVVGLFALSVNNLKGLKYIFLGYLYALFIMVFLTGIYFGLKPKDKPAIDQID